MKRNYVKPVLIKETFTLSQSIAHNCGKNLNFDHATLKSKSSCGWDLDGNDNTKGDILFASSGVCAIVTEYFYGVCYNNPEGGFNIFNS